MKKAAETLIKSFTCDTGGLLKALHALQYQHGYIDPALIPLVADTFNITKAEVKGVISFYEDFRGSPPGKHVIKVCQAEACQAVGAREITEKLRSKIGLPTDDLTCDTSATESVTVEPVFCLGLCSVAPAVSVNGELRGRVDAENFSSEIKALEEAG